MKTLELDSFKDRLRKFKQDVVNYINKNKTNELFKWFLASEIDKSTTLSCNTDLDEIISIGGDFDIYFNNIDLMTSGNNIIITFDMKCNSRKSGKEVFSRNSFYIDISHFTQFEKLGLERKKKYLEEVKRDKIKERIDKNKEEIRILQDKINRDKELLKHVE